LIKEQFPPSFSHFEGGVFGSPTATNGFTRGLLQFQDFNVGGCLRVVEAYRRWGVVDPQLTQMALERIQDIQEELSNKDVQELLELLARLGLAPDGLLKTVCQMTFRSLWAFTARQLVSVTHSLARLRFLSPRDFEELLDALTPKLGSLPGRDVARLLFAWALQDLGELRPELQRVLAVQYASCDDYDLLSDLDAAWALCVLNLSDKYSEVLVRLRHARTRDVHAGALVQLHEVLSYKSESLAARAVLRQAARHAAAAEATRLAASPLHEQVARTWRKLGLSCERKAPCGPFVVDFLEPRSQLVVDVDLLSWPVTRTLRHRYLQAHGFRTVCLPYWDLKAIRSDTDLECFMRLQTARALEENEGKCARERPAEAVAQKIAEQAAELQRCQGELRAKCEEATELEGRLKAQTAELRKCQQELGCAQVHCDSPDLCFRWMEEGPLPGQLGSARGMKQLRQSLATTRGPAQLCVGPPPADWKVLLQLRLRRAGWEPALLQLTSEEIRVFRLPCAAAWQSLGAPDFLALRDGQKDFSDLPCLEAPHQNKSVLLEGPGMERLDRKRWFLYPRGQYPWGDGPGGGFSLTDWLQLVYPTLPEEQRPLECVVEAGDVVYVPDGWYHAVVNLADTVAAPGCHLEVSFQSPQMALEPQEAFKAMSLQMVQGLWQEHPDQVKEIAEAAAAYLDQGLTNDLHARRVLFYCLMQMDPDKADQVILEGVARDPFHVPLQFELATWLAARAKEDDASALRRIRQLLPQWEPQLSANLRNQKAMWILNKFHRALGDEQTADRYFDRLVELNEKGIDR
ncbi:unnamed protein product, partial [Effrenium voratum]